MVNYLSKVWLQLEAEVADGSPGVFTIDVEAVAEAECRLPPAAVLHSMGKRPLLYFTLKRLWP